MLARARSLLCTILAPPMVKKPSIRPRPLAVMMEGSRFVSNVATDNSTEVVHDPKGQEFRIEFPNCRAILNYEGDEHLIKIMHTEVPPEMGGRGIGKILAKAALRHAEKNNLRIEVHCEYFRHYVETHEPKYLTYLEN